MYLLTSFRLSSIWNSYFGIIKGYLFFLKGQMKDTLIISHVLITLVTCMYCDCSALKQEKRYRFSLFKLANWSTSSGKQALGSRAHSTQQGATLLLPMLVVPILWAAVPSHFTRPILLALWPATCCKQTHSCAYHF